MKNENTYIMNLEGCYIYKDIINKKKITSKNKDKLKLFSATIPYSLESIRIDKIFCDTFYEEDNKQYTNKIINITFNKNYTMWDENKIWATKKGEKRKGKRKTIAHKKKIRKYLYKNGFILNGEKYIFYKRGAGKAKNGYALYIQENMKEKLIQRSRLGLEFKNNEEIDMTSLLAYESLITSGINYVINLDPKTEILLIDDIYGKEFENTSSVTRENNSNIITKNEKIKIQNCLTDGQGLMDESVFKEYKKENKGMMLLRNDFLKCCAFNTKLQKWFEYNNITTIKDMFGTIYNTNKIKLIITPNSLKFLKFAYKFTNTKTKKEYNTLNKEEQFKIKKICYEYWKENIDNIFGVVKCDKEGNFGNYNRLTYQLINSIPNLTYDDLMKITQEERKYVMLLKNDEAVFRNYLGCDAKASLKLEKQLKKGNLDLYETTNLLSALLLINSDFQYTKKFKKLKSDLISNYIGHLKEGKIRIKDTKYVTIISNPYEMLLASIGKYNGTSIMKGREIYCKYYKDKQEFCASRNPHINSGNVMYTKNKYHNEYKWFNFSDNICAINFYDNDAPDRLQGCDTDSDVILLIPNKILVEKAKYCEENFPTPINKVKGKSIPRKYNMNELYKLDCVLSNNYIGKIVNMSQIINSYLNDAISKHKDKKIINELYQISSKLSSLSQIEIDKSKKVFDNVNMSNELRKIRQLPYIEYVKDKDKFGEIVDKMVVPQFFKMISDSNEYRVFKKFNTPLDILQDVLFFNSANYQKGNKNKELYDLLLKNSKELNGRYRQQSAIAIYKIIEKCGKRINGLKLKTCTLNNKAKKTVEKKSKEKAIKHLKKLNTNESTILSILKQCFGKKKNDKFGFKKYSMLTLSLLFISKKEIVLKCFKTKNMDNDEVLIKIKEPCDLNIFGKNYQKTKRKN